MDPDQSSTPSAGGHPPYSSGQLKPTAILEPIQKSVSVQVPWYKRLFVHSVRTETIWRLSFVVLLVVGFFIGRAMQRPATTDTQAGNIYARVSLVPLQTRLPPDAFVQVWVTTDATLSNGQFDIRFDPAKVSVIDASPQEGSTIAEGITITPPSQANISGKLMIVYSSETTNEANGPIGTFQLANIKFRNKSTVPNDSTEVNLTSQTTKLSHGLTPFIISAISNTTLLLNAK